MSKITPISETEYKARNAWPIGWYAATVVDAPDSCIEKLSNAGNLMFVTKFQVYNDDGKMKFVTAYIMADGAAAWQLRSASEALGVLDQYRAGEIKENDLKGKSCFVKLGIEIDKDGVYEDKNVIKEFKKKMPGKITAADIPKPTEAKASYIDDSIPF